jgi:hypothetical protein
VRVDNSGGGLDLDARVDPAGAKALLQFLASPAAEAIWRDAEYERYEPHR